MKRKLIDIPEDSLDKIKIKAAACGQSPKRYIENLVEKDSQELNDISVGYGRYGFSSISEPSVAALRGILYEAAEDAARRRADTEREYFEKIEQEIYGKR